MGPSHSSCPRTRCCSCSYGQLEGLAATIPHVSTEYLGSHGCLSRGTFPLLGLTCRHFPNGLSFETNMGFVLYFRILEAKCQPVSTVIHTLHSLLLVRSPHVPILEQIGVRREV